MLFWGAWGAYGVYLLQELGRSIVELLNYFNLKLKIEL